MKNPHTINDEIDLRTKDVIKVVVLKAFSKTLLQLLSKTIIRYDTAINNKKKNLSYNQKEKMENTLESIKVVKYKFEDFISNLNGSNEPIMPKNLAIRILRFFNAIDIFFLERDIRELNEWYF